MSTYPLTSMPVIPATEDVSLFWKQGIAQSPFSGVSAIINNYAQWSVNLTFPALKRGSNKAKELQAWLVSLRGSEGSFLYQPANSGKNITGKSTVNIGYADSRAINVGGWAFGQATGLVAGDYFSINNQLHQITSVAATASNNTVTLNFEPALRKDIPAGTLVNFDSPKVELRWVGGDSSPGYNVDPSAIYFKPLSCAQVI